ncbi:MAG TPA: hypothetical protein VHU23_11330 [Rhizomicrobium sp.]|jgi:hypothetical protein|nr:hypothetical protein [Rhizomicrobium sp.]
MKLSGDIRFPHPVLGLDTNDYTAGEFLSAIRVKEDFSQSTIEISVDTTVSDAALTNLITAGKASAGVFITCPATYFNVARPVQLGVSNLRFSAGSLWGRVVIRPFIWSNETISKWQNPNVHHEFSQDGFELAKGTLLAAGDEHAFSVGRDKLAPIESIFEMRRATDYPTGKMTVSLDNQKIVILLSSDVHEAVSNLRANSIGRVVLMNSVYLPAIMEVLSMLADGEGNHEGLRWHSAFIAKCDHLGISTTSPKIFEDAQKLLEAPAAGMRFVAERIT